MERKNRNPHGGNDFRPARPMDARRVALNAISDVNRAGAYASLALTKRLNEAVLSPEDRRLATTIFYTAVENRLYIDHVMSQLLKYAPQPIIYDIFIIACAQILFLDKIPAHAAVDEAVKQVKRLHMPEQAGFVNGTLRNLLRAIEGGTLTFPKREDDEDKYLSIMYSVPEGLIAVLKKRFDPEFTEKLITYKDESHGEVLRPNLLRSTCAAFESYLDSKSIEWRKSPVDGLYRVHNAGDLANDPGFLSGMFTIQGESSVLAARAVSAKTAETILDACAAPGGKSACIAEDMHNTGRIYAWDLHDHRVRLIKATAERLGLDTVRPAVRDASQLREDMIGAMDAVLVDAPCSGLGVIFNKPDIKYKATEKSVSELRETQKKILSVCSEYVRPGGRLVYSTCSVLPDENEEQVEAFLASHPDFVPDTGAKWLPEHLRRKLNNGMITFIPHEDGMDGFFIARMIRKG